MHYRLFDYLDSGLHHQRKTLSSLGHRLGHKIENYSRIHSSAPHLVPRFCTRAFLLPIARNNQSGYFLLPLQLVVIVQADHRLFKFMRSSSQIFLIFFELDLNFAHLTHQISFVAF